MSSGGYTLVEMLIVVVILAILATVLSLHFTDFTTETKEASLQTTLGLMRRAINHYRQDHDQFPGASASSGANCPNGGTAGVSSKAGGKSFGDQLTMYTNSAGLACSTRDGEFKYGPYIKTSVLGENGLPVNPITAKNKMKLVADGSLDLNSSSTKGGWKFDYISGKMIVDHEDYDDL